MQTSLPRLVGIVAGLTVATVLVSPVLAAPLSSSYSVTGVEIAATSTEGTFVGSAVGTGGDQAVWQAVVVHQVLAPGCYLSAEGCPITGGTLSLVNEQVETIEGVFGSGSIRLVSAARGCGVQVFEVIGNLTDVNTATTTGGIGTFVVRLTHFRARVHGQCTTFFATVSGTVSFSF